MPSPAPNQKGMTMLDKVSSTQIAAHFHRSACKRHDEAQAAWERDPENAELKRAADIAYNLMRSSMNGLIDDINDLACWMLTRKECRCLVVYRLDDTIALIDRLA